MLALLEEGVAVKVIGDLTDLSFSTIYQVIYKCGYHPVTNSADKNSNSDDDDNNDEDSDR